MGRTFVSDYTISAAEKCKQFSITMKLHKVGSLIGFIPKDVLKNIKAKWQSIDITSGIFGENNMSVQACESSIYSYSKNRVKSKVALDDQIKNGDVVKVLLDFEAQTITFFHGDRPGIVTHKSIACDQVYIPAVSLGSMQEAECIDVYMVYK